MADSNGGGARKRQTSEGAAPQDGSERRNQPSHDVPQSIGNGFAQYYAYPSSHDGPESQYKTYSEYVDSLRSWMAQYHNHQYWQQMQNWCYMTLPLYLSMQTLPSQSSPTLAQGFSAGIQAPFAPQSPLRAPPGVQQQQLPRQQPQQQQIGYIFKIPPLWKRVAAEFIDFLILFVIKLGVTLIAVEYLGIVDIQKYEVDFLFSMGEIDYEKAFALTSELVAIEVINRICICLFETMCLRKGIGTVGGTTPGKRMMGLRVVSCDDVADLPDGRIRVIPAGDIGFWNALVRSVIKNFSLAFFFPVCFTVFFFQHNRAAYDIISQSMVVELGEIQ